MTKKQLNFNAIQSSLQTLVDIVVLKEMRNLAMVKFGLSPSKKCFYLLRRKPFKLMKNAF